MWCVPLTLHSSAFLFCVRDTAKVDLVPNNKKKWIQNRASQKWKKVKIDAPKRKVLVLLWSIRVMVWSR